MRGKGKSGATTAAKENAVNTVAKKAESTIEAVAEKAKEAVKKVEVKEEAVKETFAETKAEVKACHVSVECQLRFRQELLLQSQKETK